MNLYRFLRVKFAKSLSPIPQSDDFLFKRWLNVHPISEMQIGELYSELRDTDKIILRIDKPVYEQYRFAIGKVKLYKSSIKSLELKTKTNLVFFGFGVAQAYKINIDFNQELKDYFSAKFETENNSFFVSIKEPNKSERKEELTSNQQDISFSFAIENSISKNYQVKGVTRVKEINSSINIVEPIEINYHIKSPEVIDYLSKLIPQIYNIDILSSFDQMKEEGKIFEKKINLLDEQPEISKHISLDNLTTSEVITPKIDFNLSHDLPIQSYSVESLENKFKIFEYHLPEFSDKTNLLLSYSFEENVRNGKTEETLPDEDLENTLYKSLQPVIELNSEEEENILSGLYNYQKEGAKFLSENSKAILGDELGLGKSVQAIAALKILLKKKEIKSSIIVAQKYSIGITNFTNSEYHFGWVDHFNKFAPELNFKVLPDEIENLGKELFKANQISIISYDLFKEYLAQFNHDDNTKHKYEAIILDDYDALGDDVEFFNKWLSTAKAKFIWKLENFTKEKGDLVLSRTKDQIEKELPELSFQDYWVNMHEEQQKDYTQSLFYSQNEITEVYETGNPYRFQSKVFFALHQLKQVCNFSEHDDFSSKADLILTHVKSLAACGEKIIVISQYDKSGTQKLGEIFNQQGIKYVNYLSGMSSSDMEEAVQKFNNDKSINVLIKGTKNEITKLQLVNATYVLFFDQWWIPSMQWQIEEEIKVKKPSESKIHFIYYLNRNTIDEKILFKLYEKGLMLKNLVETFSVESYSKLITEEEWFEIFDIPRKEKSADIELSDSKEKLMSMSKSEVIANINLLFANLGYRNLKLIEQDDTIYILKGSYIKKEKRKDFSALCVINKDRPNDKLISEFIRNSMNDKQVGKLFLITLFLNYKNPALELSNKITLLNGTSLSKYFRTFQII